MSPGYSETLHLRNAGCRVDFSDANMPFLKDGSDSGSDYGLVGFMALIVNSMMIWRISFKKLYWILNVLGFALLAFSLSDGRLDALESPIPLSELYFVRPEFGEC